MKLTNRAGLPDPIIWAMESFIYSRGDSDYSATDLLAPTQQVLLKRRYGDQIVEEAGDSIWLLFGNLMHKMLEQANTDNALTEERFFATALGRKISGAVDLFWKNGIWDWKTTSAWTAVFGSRNTEYEQQLNIYCWLLRQNGFEPDALRIVCLYRDWQKSKALADAQYPQNNVQVIRFPMWSPAQQLKFIETRLAALIKWENAPDNVLPECEAEEMWAQPTKYAVMKEGRKSAVRVVESEDEADQILSDQKNPDLHSVVVRPGKRTRCEEYCSVNQWCSQYQQYTQSQPTEESHGTQS